MNEVMLKLVRMLDASENEAATALKKLRQNKFSFVDLIGRTNPAGPPPASRPPSFEKEYEYEAALADLQNERNLAWTEADGLRRELKASYERASKTPWKKIALAVIGTLVVAITTPVGALLAISTSKPRTFDDGIVFIEQNICKLKSTGCPATVPIKIETRVKDMVSATKIIPAHTQTVKADTDFFLPPGAVVTLPDMGGSDTGWTRIRSRHGEGFIHGIPIITFPLMTTTFGGHQSRRLNSQQDKR